MRLTKFVLILRLVENSSVLAMNGLKQCSKIKESRISQLIMLKINLIQIIIPNYQDRQLI